MFNFHQKFAQWRRPSWKFICDTPDFIFTEDNPPSRPPAARVEFLPWRGTWQGACEWLEAHKCFKVVRVFEPGHEVHYKIDWTSYRELVPAKWAAICATPETAGAFHTPVLIRSEAIAFVLGNGGHSIKSVDDEFCIVWYYKKE